MKLRRAANYSLAVCLASLSAQGCEVDSYDGAPRKTASGAADGTVPSGKVEGDIYLVADSGDARRLASVPLGLVWDSDTLRSALALLCRSHEALQQPYLDKARALTRQAETSPARDVRSTLSGLKQLSILMDSTVAVARVIGALGVRSPHYPLDRAFLRPPT